MTILLGSTQKNQTGLSGQYSSAPLTKSAAAVKAAHLPRLTQTGTGEGGPTHGPWVGFSCFFRRFKQPVVQLVVLHVTLNF